MSPLHDASPIVMDTSVSGSQALAAMKCRRDPTSVETLVGWNACAQG